MEWTVNRIQSTIFGLFMKLYYVKEFIYQLLRSIIFFSVYVKIQSNYNVTNQMYSFQFNLKWNVDFLVSINSKNVVNVWIQVGNSNVWRLCTMQMKNEYSSQFRNE